MRPQKSAMPKRDRNIRGLYLANLFWPLQELRNLRNPPFVPEPEFTRFDVNPLQSQRRTPRGLLNLSTHHCPPTSARFFKVNYPMPSMVSGLPWRFAKSTEYPVVPDPQFTRLDLLNIATR
jgi:hypothetical protein